MELAQGDAAAAGKAAERGTGAGLLRGGLPQGPAAAPAGHERRGAGRTLLSLRRIVITGIGSARLSVRSVCRAVTMGTVGAILSGKKLGCCTCWL